MKSKKILFFCIVALLCEIGSSQRESSTRLSKWAQPVESGSLKNLFKLTDDIYRSGQPNKYGFAELSRMGIKTILNLREYHADEDKTEGTTLKTIHLKMDAGDIKDDEVVEALNMITKSPKPLLIHCWHGSDRTGLVCAMYRIIYQDWSKQEAIEELVNGGFGYHEMYKNIPQYIEQVNIDQIKKQLAIYPK